MLNNDHESFAAAQARAAAAVSCESVVLPSGSQRRGGQQDR